MQQLVADFDAAAEKVPRWAADLEDAAAAILQNKGWLTREFTDESSTSKGAIGFDILLDEPDLQEPIVTQTHSNESIRLWRADLSLFISQQNEHHLASQQVACGEFFENVESSPLTPEQIRAVVNFDNRVLVVASAGSGKTSTMVAKAGYALHRKLIAPEKILLLAFNAAAAKELQQRIHERLTQLGLDADQVVAQTFHAFGLSVIGPATGKKPSLAPRLDGGGDIDQLGRIVDHLRASDPSFRSHWDFFRAVLARDYPDSEKDNDDNDDNGAPEAAIHRTAQGEVVKSAGERMIADWFFFNGVDYAYERPYEIDTAKATSASIILTSTIRPSAPITSIGRSIRMAKPRQSSPATSTACNGSGPPTSRTARRYWRRRWPNCGVAPGYNTWPMS